MGLIIKNKLPELMQGYPTISDKYDVAPAVVAATETGEIVAGQAVALTGTAGIYTDVKATTAIGQIAGFVLATNVKVPTEYPAPATIQKYVAGQAFNLMIKGFIAAPVTLGDAETITNGQEVYIMIGGDFAGMLTVSGHTEASGTATQLPGAFYTGLTMTNDAGTLLAEICYNL